MSRMALATLASRWLSLWSAPIRTRVEQVVVDEAASTVAVPWSAQGDISDHAPLS